MIAREIAITNKVGLHARPAALFTQEAKKYSSDISINYKDRTANAKSIVELIILGANEGSKILIEADGKDEEEAILGLIALVESDFVDPKTNNS